MRVVHIEAGRHLYGGAVQVRYLVEGLARAGVDSRLICAAGGALAGGASAETIALPMRGDLDLALVGRLRPLLARLRPDVVHVHSRRGAELFGGRACALERLPAVVTRRVDSRDRGLWARLKYRPYARVIALSSAIAAELARCGVEQARIRTIPSAVDTERYRPDSTAHVRLRTEHGLPSDALVVTVVAQLIARKNHELLLRELPALAARHPRLRVLFFGRGPLERPLRERIRALELGAVVRLAGFRDDLPALLPGADVLVHPAHREGLGVALLEALAAGVPVVACAAGGVVDLIQHDVNGVLVPPGDAAALRAALDRLLADPAGRLRLGAAGRAQVQRAFSIDRMVDRHLEVYADVAH